MKVSEITIRDVAAYIELDDPDHLEAEDEKILNLALPAAKAYVQSYTGLSAEEIEKHEDIPLAIYALCQNAYDNRSYETKTSIINNVNKVVQSILDLHRVNLL